MVDALASGVSVLTDVGVQVPPLAPKTTLILLALGEGTPLPRIDLLRRFVSGCFFSVFFIYLSHPG